jgi:thiol-disulfide isomerase/thioredoxin
MRSPKTHLLRRAASSILLGLGALSCVLAAFVLQATPDIRPILLTALGGFLVAGGLSPSRLTTAISGLVPALLLSRFNLAFTDHFYLAAFALIAAFAVAATAAAAWLKAHARAKSAALIAAGACAAAVAATYLAIPALEERHAYISVDKPLAPFTLRSLSGESVNSDTWRGKVVVVSYWATWCPPCLAELPKVAALQQMYRGDSRVEIIALNAGSGGDTAQKASSFLQRRNLELSSYIDDVYADDARRAGMAARSLGLKVVPTLFIVNRSGRLVAIHTGYDNSEDLLTTLPRRISGLLSGG